jgi:hypothetical protein
MTQAEPQGLAKGLRLATSEQRSIQGAFVRWIAPFAKPGTWLEANQGENNDG